MNNQEYTYHYSDGIGFTDGRKVWLLQKEKGGSLFFAIERPFQAGDENLPIAGRKVRKGTHPPATTRDKNNTIVTTVLKVSIEAAYAMRLLYTNWSKETKGGTQ